ncbi:MAG: 30S ribosomal protein S20 [Syntrophobacterales bacterium]|nr:30S ribosomal protein S20 [Syntrophobacterales bacterium]
MATHKSAEKRNRQNKKRRVRNMSTKSLVKTMTKKVIKAVGEKDQEGAKKKLLEAVVAIDKAASKRVFHKNTAARKISKLTRKVNSLA